MERVRLIFVLEARLICNRRAVLSLYLLPLLSRRGVAGTVVPSSQLGVEMKRALSGAVQHHPLLKYNLARNDTLFLHSASLNKPNWTTSEEPKMTLLVLWRWKLFHNSKLRRNRPALSQC